MQIFSHNPNMSIVSLQLYAAADRIQRSGTSGVYSLRLVHRALGLEHRDVDIALEIALSIRPGETAEVTGDANTDGIANVVQSLIPEIWTTDDKPHGATLEEVTTLLDEVGVVLGSPIHHHVEPGKCLIYYKHAMILFIAHQRH